ncbi:hypothetical protein L1987_81725 [Smallanthus sonchifolius]|uniref:Uncharacterized protein n=1 Tax=Smallanthus sonchifolius TaxID=185202 RepID=A0ACB8YQI8_9ASTR|nr:hypothetical protein L1987_81725 [Smallanthus sonchifolius]
MTKPPFVLRRSLEERRQLLQQHSSCRSKTMAEVVGGTTAEVAAVCCCFPCSVVDFTFLTMYKVPAGMCKNAMRRSRRRRLAATHRNGGGGRERSIDEELAMHPAVVAAAERFLMPAPDKDMLALDDEMWENFSDSGFWRSPSKKG